ncbi:MAG TPA: hypothetical protein PLX41_01070 [Bacteroidales bacterium]|nr:hypothetical protein [Bacteroidales bacterium]HPR72227.1 hypothetical protein [Bacteroidales bacterium]
MTENNKKSYGPLLAKIISVVFHPILMPLYGLLVIFFAPTILAYLPPAAKRILFLIVLIDNVIVPLSLMPYLRYRNIITSWAISERKERVLPLIITSLLYAFTVYLLHRFSIPFFIKSFTLATLIVSVSLTLVNFRWKISIHSAGMGGLISLIVVLSLKMHVSLIGCLIGAVLLAGVVMTSRLYLKSHTPAEVWSGFFLGLLVSGAVLVIL